MSLIDFKKIILRPFGFNFIARYVDDNPTSESIDDGEIVIVGSRSYQKWAYLKCPCGCGNTTMLSLSTKRRPSWSVHLNWMMIPTVYPSVRDVGSCYAHYWIKKGKIHWCRDTGIKFSDYDEGIGIRTIKRVLHKGPGALHDKLPRWISLVIVIRKK